MHRAQAFWIDTGWGCGGVEVLNGLVVGGAPIFKKLFLRRISEIADTYDVRLLSAKKKTLSDRIKQNQKDAIK